MNKLINKVLNSYSSSLLLLVVYAILMAVATIIEKYYGTPAAKQWVYYSPLFFLVHVLLVLNFFFTSISHKLLSQRRLGLLLTHCSFVVILVGATISHIFSEEGIVHIRQGESTNTMVVQDDQQTVRQLPFTLELVKFTVHRYPGSSSPSSYESDLKVYVDNQVRPALIYMNNILDVKGYRLYQASFDQDEMGTILSVNKDVAGRNVTYIGYILLFLGLVLSIVGKNTRFIRLYTQLKSMQMLLAAVVASTFMTSRANAQEVNIDKYTVDAAHAQKFGAMPVQSVRGRIMPMNTFSSEVLRKVHKSTTIAGMNSDQFMLSVLCFPHVWMQQPMIEVKDEQILSKYNLKQGYSAYLDFFDVHGDYKLQEELNHIYQKMPKDRDAFEKDLLKIDEQINTLYEIFSFRLVNIFPRENDKNHKWYAPGDDLSVFEGKDSMFVSQITGWYIQEVTDAVQSNNYQQADKVLGMIRTYQNARDKSLSGIQKKIDAEVRYNKLEIFKWCKMGFLIFGGLLLVLGFVGMFSHSRLRKCLVAVLGVAVLITFIYQMVGMGLRWYISGNAPSNSYETMIYVAWAVVCAGIVFARRSTITFGLSTIFAGVILFVSSLSWLDPHITPLVPVLKSPWLISHVTMIITAYGFMGISFLLGATNLVMMSIVGRKVDIIKERIKELTIINEMCLWLALAFLAVGIFLGAVWANESWGRYWGWDPKEVWALITMVVYAVVLHSHLVKSTNNTWAFNLMSVVAFSSVIMTYFGVNYLLSGMHSYGNTDGVGNLPYYLVVICAAVVVLAIYSKKGYNKNK